MNTSHYRHAGFTLLQGLALWFALASKDALAQKTAASRLPDSPEDAATDRDTKASLPLVHYTFAATGAPRGTVGARLTGFGLGERGQPAVLGGGLSVWGSPVSRLTLIGDATRSVYREFAPSAGAMLHLLGHRTRGLSLGVLARYKVEGLGRRPTKDEVEGEVEGGLLWGHHQRGLHLEANANPGVGAAEEGEVDLEARARAGYDRPHDHWHRGGQCT
jgi:hypothetical protein